MKCRDVERLLFEDLSAARQTEVEDHLSRCPECRKLCDHLAAIEDLKCSLTRESEAPSGFTGKVFTQVGRTDRGSRFSRYAMMMAAVVVTGAGIALSTIDWSVSTPTPQVSGRVSPDTTPARSGLGIDRPLEAEWMTERRKVESSFVEVMITDSLGRVYILRVPSTTEIRRTELRRDYLTNASF